MKYFKDSMDNVFGIDEDQSGIILNSWVEISEGDMKSIKESKKNIAEKEKELEDAEWAEYMMAEEADKKTAWKLAGKPKYKGN